MATRRSARSDLVICALFFLFVYGLPAEAEVSRQEKIKIRLNVEQALAKLDDTVARISDLEYVRRIYWSFKGRSPTKAEADNVVGFLVGDVENHVDRNGRVHQCRVQLKRSDVFLRFLKHKVGVKEHFDYAWLKNNF